MTQTAERLAAPRRDVAGELSLAADIGGTHARIGLMEGLPGGSWVSVRAYHEYLCAEHDGLEGIVRDFLDHHACGSVARGVLACAGCVIDGVVVNDNLPWNVVVDDLRESLELDDLVLINDFEAVAYATQYLHPDDVLLLSGAAAGTRRNPQVVVGPGTGLGSAVLLPGASRPAVLAGEAGQIALAPRNELEAEILRIFARTTGHVSCEHALSGPGLLHLYRALCTIERIAPGLDSPEAVTRAAQADDDAQAHQALQVFCAMLGSFVGDLAVLYRASGGIWLAGGILSTIRDFLIRSEFVERFLDKGRMRGFLERVPIRLMEHGRHGVLGAAYWYLGTRAPAEDALRARTH
ncbi:MAG TPA: glucokinase [Rhodanobacteraceae bacterium]|nr:glucokinase [Rhodanobacteraceae bacterium]